jgi:bacterioferritin
MKNQELLRMLSFDMESEHAAIIQYLNHAYGIGEGEIACEVEAIAREEMRHFDFLAEKIIDIGGKISLERGNMRLGGQSVEDWMKNDVLLEEDAIGPYSKQIEIIDEPDIVVLLRRILSDEKAHHEKFSHFVKKSKVENMRDIRGSLENDVNKFLNWGIGHEYTVILQYLLHSYLANDEKTKNELQDQATNEMQHLGWLAEELVGQNGNPRIEHDAINRSRSVQNMLKADIKLEKHVSAEYNRGAREIISDEKMKKLIIRIRDNEIYHAEVFGKLLKPGKSK